MFNKIELYDMKTMTFYYVWILNHVQMVFLIGIDEINPYSYKSNKIAFCRNSFFV